MESYQKNYAVNHFGIPGCFSTSLSYSSIHRGHRLGALRFNAILTLPEDNIRSHRLRAQSPRLPPLRVLVARLRCHLCFWQTSCKLKVFMTHSLGLTNLLEMLTVYYKGCYKRYRWTLKLRGKWDEVWKGPEHSSFCPCGTEVGYCPSTRMY